MIVTINKNRFQILISTILGCLYYMKTNDQMFSVLLVLGSSLILRSLKIDILINNYINNESFLNFKTKKERNQFCKSMFDASTVASSDSKAKKWSESKKYLKALQTTKTELTNWNKKYNK